MKALRITFYTLLGILLVAIAAAVVFALTFDANRYKPDIEALVLKHTGHVLTIDGDIDLTLFPDIGAALGQTTLSSQDSNEALVTVNRAQLSVALWPLINSQVFVNGVSVDGVNANITRDPAGRLNFADWLSDSTNLANHEHTDSKLIDAASSVAPSSVQAPTTSVSFDVNSIDITNSQVNYTDRQSGVDWTISDLSIQTGQIAQRASGKVNVSAKVASKGLALDTGITIQSDYSLDWPKQSIDFEQLSVQLDGSWHDLRSIDANASLNVHADLENESLTLNRINTKLSAQHFEQNINLSFDAGQIRHTKNKGKNTLTISPSNLAVTVNGTGRDVSTALKLPAIESDGETLSLKELAVNVTIQDQALGQTPLKVQAQGSLSLNSQTERFNSQWQGQFDGSPITARLDVAGFTKPALSFDVALEEVRLERFGIAGNPQSTVQTEPKTTAASAASDAPATPSTTINLDPLKGHNIKGKLQINRALSKGIVVDNIKADIVLNQGKLSVAPHSAELFGGKLSGSLAIDAFTNQFTLQENITDIELEALLKALSQKPRASGKTGLILDLSSSGNTAAALQRNLAGKVHVDLRDGAVKGIDIGAIINNVRSMLDKAPSEQEATAGQTAGQTAFSSLSASATIAKGIATNKDLSIKAPLFRLEGAGTVNIPRSSIDYLAKVAVVETTSGQGGKDLAALRGVMIPIKISGQFDNPRYSVDVASLAAEVAKSSLGNKARDEINKVLPGLGDALKGLFGR